MNRPAVKAAPALGVSPPGYAAPPQVTLYPNAWQALAGVRVSLAQVLRGIRNGHWQGQVEHVRRAASKAARDSAKKSVPAFTASGTFPQGRSLRGLAEPSHLVAVDFDAQENPTILQQRAQLQADPFTHVCALSVSGTGLFLLVRLRPGADHGQAFDGLKAYYQRRYGLGADRACRDVCRLRFISYDPQLYEQPQAREFVPSPLPPPAPRPRINQPYDPSGVDSGFDFAATVAAVERSGRDITSGYQNWLRLGLALAMNLHEQGREVFHRLSRAHPHYEPALCDKKYDSCLRQKGTKKASLGTFYYLVKQAGLAPVTRRAAQLG